MSRPKVILLGDSAVGKSKLVERYLMDEYNPRQLSTFALTLFRKNARLDDGSDIKVGACVKPLLSCSEKRSGA